MNLPFLANAAAETGNLDFTSGGSWWQAVGGLTVVFGLLILFLKLMGKINKRGNQVDTSLVAVWHLGPKREIQVLRLGDMVHYIYRHDGSMVVLKEESHAEFLAVHGKQTNPAQPPANWKNLLGGRLPFQTTNSSA